MSLFDPQFEPVQGTATPLTPEQAEEFLSRGVTEVIPRELFVKKLTSGERMRIYLGADPTSPQLHVGHAVILRALRRLQDLGHEIIFLIGDFTARIGDPTGKDEARVALTPAEVLKNAESYKEQAQHILDFTDAHPNPARVLFNSQWLEALRFDDVMRLAAHFTVQQMLERDMFDRRLVEGKPIFVHEFFYPMMQGYDSLAMNVDVEVGGSDQLFNILAGRDLLHAGTGREKIALTFELLLGLDGRKMSKSYGNTIGIADVPTEMYGKVMALADELIEKYFWLCTDATREEIEAVQAELDAGANPRDVKMRLAHALVSVYHGADVADAAQAEFVQVFQKKERPTEMPEVSVLLGDDGMIGLIDLVVTSGCASSNGEARRVIEQGGVRLNNERIVDAAARVSVENGDIVQVGKRKFVRLTVNA
jgi:tyrosyl-tRNA synthetase